MDCSLRWATKGVLGLLLTQVWVGWIRGDGGGKGQLTTRQRHWSPFIDNSHIGQGKNATFSDTFFVLSCPFFLSRCAQLIVFVDPPTTTFSIHPWILQLRDNRFKYIPTHEAEERALHLVTISPGLGLGSPSISHRGRFQWEGLVFAVLAQAHTVYKESVCMYYHNLRKEDKYLY